MADIDPQIQAAVQEFAAKLTAIMRERAAAALHASFAGGGTVPTAAPKRKPGRPVKSGTAAVAPASAKPAKKAPAARKTAKRGRLGEQEIAAAADKILEIVKKKPNQRSEDIRSASGMDKNLYQAALRKLRDEDEVKSKGSKRATTYAPA